MSLQCKYVWRRDDLSRCFQERYLQTLLPLLTCAISLLIVVTRVVSRLVRTRTRDGNYAALIQVNDEESEDDEDENDSLADLTLQRTVSNARASISGVSKPTGELWLVAVEFIALLGQVAVALVSLLVLDHSTHGKFWVASISSVVVWSYVAFLAGTRLYLSATHSHVSALKLWNHTFALYGTQWLLEAFVFRSAIIHPRGRLLQILTSIQFALTTLLTLIALLSRRGNREVTLEYEGDIEPSREPLASVLSILSYSWVDPIIWNGFKKPLDLEDVWNLTIKDKAENVLASFRHIKKTHKLAFRLLLFFKKPLLIQGLWCMIGSVFLFLPTLLLKVILEHLEDPERVPKNAAWLYVILLFVTGVTSAASDGRALWMGRRICIQLRGVIIGEIYSKVLRRKAAASTETDLGSKSSPPLSFWQRVKKWSRKKPAAVPQDNGNKDKASDAQINNGTVINLMSIDSFKVSEVSSYLHFLWASVPVQLIMAVSLLYKVLGYSSFAGIALMVLVLPLNLFIAQSFQKAQKRIMAATDGRIHATNEVLQNIRIIKYFAWEQRFALNVNEKRNTELSALWRKYILWSSAATIWSGVPILITFASFFVFTIIEKRRLTPSIAFPALSMFSLLRVPLDQLADMVAHVQECKVSIDRVEEFLQEEETEKYQQVKMSRQASPHDTRIALQNATLTWGVNAENSSGTAVASFRLINIDVEFVVGKLNVIAGPTGSGKTSLLMAMLGEMKLMNGLVFIPGGYSRQDLRPDSVTGLTESVAYCAQQAWLVNATIQENVLFANPYDPNRYHAVIEACALTRDLEILDSGDQTLVGEKGITLSGGQKQRISLARALYSNSRHLLLDDCLSAVDSHTAKHIFEQALTGDLMHDRTCILVSHNIILTVPQASFVVLLENGKVVAQGEPRKVIESGMLGEEILKSRPASKLPSPNTSLAPSRTPSDLEERTTHLSGTQQPNGHANGHVNGKINGIARNKDNNIADTQLEKKATGSVKLSTIKMYLGSMGPWYYWIIAAFGFIAVQIGSVATNLWIRQWANAYAPRHTEQGPYHTMHPALSSRSHAFSGVRLMQFTYFSSYADVSVTGHSSPKVDDGYYLGIYAILGVVFVFICFARELILFWGSQRAAWTLHDRLLHSILRATFRFFDSTPLGQLTNRFSKDIQAIDQEVAPVAVGMFHSATSVITIVVLITAITPGFLIPGFFIACIYVATGLFYVKSSRDLKRIESVQRSPLFQHFGETLSGVVTIRAYGEEARFVQDSHHRVNTHSRPFIYLWATNRWLAFRIDVAGALVSFFAAAFVVINAGKIDAGAAGLSLSYAITFTQNVLWLVRLYASNEQNMNAVERVQEYIDVDQEAPAEVPETKPAANWPSQGAVHFVDYSTRYRKELDPVLKHMTFKISAGEKVGIVGRTGAGKSSLALALFRGLEAEEGKIIIDDIDIGLIGLQDLREAITIVPQDPTLFTGTLRTNLDPFELFTDEQIFEALRRVQLISNKDDEIDLSESSSRQPASQPIEVLSVPTVTATDYTTHPTTDQANPAASTLSSGEPLVQYISNTEDGNKNVFLNLSSPIAESGSNLSQGQRQLLCLARALLKSPKVLVMDEATASIDYATDSKIQDTLRELKNNTIITIAHRLQTIIDYDKVLVLDKGEIVEYADPWELIRKEGGSFRSMCETNGDLEVLEGLAKKAWEERRLVDDS